MNLIQIFRTIGCIGDSLSSGEFEYDAGNGVKGYWDCYEYSWGKQIERMTGVQVTNFSRGGLTAYQLYLDADSQTSPIQDINMLFQKENAKQAYIIALGVNDFKGKDVLQNVYGGQIGNVKTDIVHDDFHKNPRTFVGEYARIIQRLQSIQHDAKFFLVTMPREAEESPLEEQFAQVIRELARELPNCYVIDLYKDGDIYDEPFRKKYFCGHMNAMGYLYTANKIMECMNNIIDENWTDFRYVQFIGSEYEPFGFSDAF